MPQFERSDDALRQLLDHHEVTRLLTRYAVALDTRDWPLLRSCFLADAVFEFGVRRGTGAGIEAIVRTCHRALSGLDASQHIVGSFLVDLDCDRGAASTYVQAQHYLVSASGANTFLVGGRYHDRLLRTADGWRIEHRRLETLWTDGNIGVFAEAEARLRDRGQEEPAT